jgi:hypothetical protein
MGERCKIETLLERLGPYLKTFRTKSKRSIAPTMHKVAPRVCRQAVVRLLRTAALPSLTRRHVARASPWRYTATPARIPHTTNNAAIRPACHCPAEPDNYWFASKRTVGHNCPRQSQHLGNEVTNDANTNGPPCIRAYLQVQLIAKLSLLISTMGRLDVKGSTAPT